MSPRVDRSAYGYPSLVVYPSTIHTIRWLTTAGYGSPSTLRNGATFCTTCRGSRLNRIREFDEIAPEKRMLRSLYFSENTSRLKKLPIRTPPPPWYTFLTSAPPLPDLSNSRAPWPFCTPVI